jgi:plastocyanin
MKNHFTFFAVFFSIIISVNATTYTITNSGASFVPDNIQILLGDTVVFNIASNHDAVEVSQATWNSNGNLQNGGFVLPMGGGVLTGLGLGVHYYVCTLHAAFGMKGKIEVSNNMGVAENFNLFSNDVFPNPFSKNLQVKFNVIDVDNDYIKITNIIGETLFKQQADLKEGINSFNLDLGLLPKGLYFVSFKQNGVIKTKKLLKQ